MSATSELTGWLALGVAAVWASQGIRASIVSRRAMATSRRERARKWQWLALAALQALLGAWNLAGEPDIYAALFWWLIAGYAAVLVWVVWTDLGGWLRSRRRAGEPSRSGPAPGC